MTIKVIIVGHLDSVEALKQALKQALICETLTYSTPHDDGGNKLTIKAVGGQGYNLPEW